jgi:endosialidase-like protein
MRENGRRHRGAWGLLFVLAIVGPTGVGVTATAAGGESDVVGLTPCRLVDTRGNGFGDPFGPPALVTGVPRDFPLQGQCGIPATAVAVSLNVTATNTLGPGFLLLHPQGGAQPLVSTLNYLAGETVANAALVPLGPGGLTVVAGVSGTDLVLDVNGYFTDSLVHGAGSDLFVGVPIAPASGAANTTVGAQALRVNTTGSLNTAIGAFALLNNTTGRNNTAIGADAALSNNGDNNTAIGTSALFFNTTGVANTAVGYNALGINSTGSGNIAIGVNAANLVTGSNNIHIGNNGEAGDTLTIKVGFPGFQTRTFIAGIHNVLPPAPDVRQVVIDSNGQLGTEPPPPSTRRVKADIEDIGERSRAVHSLRPVTFHYRARPDGPLEYGLIAEEVAEVYPDLVVRDAGGEPQTVRYQMLPPLMLSELQRHERVLAEKDRELRAQAEKLEAQGARLTELTATVAELATELARLRAHGPAAERQDDGR